jgi:hypothetical protein
LRYSRSASPIFSTAIAVYCSEESDCRRKASWRSKISSDEPRFRGTLLGSPFVLQKGLRWYKLRKPHDATAELGVRRLYALACLCRIYEPINLGPWNARGGSLHSCRVG